MMPGLIFLALVASQPVAVDAELLAGLPMVEARFDDHGVATTCSGPRLASVVARMGLPSGTAVRGKALTSGIIARARDGYEVLFSLGEIDPLLGDAPIIIATSCDGHPLPSDRGPYRLIVEGEARGARSLWALESLSFVGPD